MIYCTEEEISEILNEYGQLEAKSKGGPYEISSTLANKGLALIRQYTFDMTKVKIAPGELERRFVIDLFQVMLNSAKSYYEAKQGKAVRVINTKGIVIKYFEN